MPDTLEYIGKSAFQCCSGLTSIALPKGTTCVRPQTFQLCGSLTSVTLPETLTDIGSHAFSGCSGLTSITLPNAVINIANEAFAMCGFTSLTLPNSLTCIGHYAFQRCRVLSTVNLPDSLTNIGNSAFAYCNYDPDDEGDPYTKGLKRSYKNNKGLALTLSKNSALCHISHDAFYKTFVQKIILRTPKSRAAFIAWSVGHSHHRSNWQLTTLKHVRNVLRLITIFALENAREFEHPFQFSKPKFEWGPDITDRRVLLLLMVRATSDSRSLN